MSQTKLSMNSGKGQQELIMEPSIRKHPILRRFSGQWLVLDTTQLFLWLNAKRNF